VLAVTMRSREALETESPIGRLLDGRREVLSMAPHRLLRVA
jgi:hypothetical protein